MIDVNYHWAVKLTLCSSRGESLDTKSRFMIALPQRVTGFNKEQLTCAFSNISIKFQTIVKCLKIAPPSIFFLMNMFMPMYTLIFADNALSIHIVALDPALSVLYNIHQSKNRFSTIFQRERLFNSEWCPIANDYCQWFCHVNQTCLLLTVI